MEEKKEVKIKLGTVLNIIAIVVILIVILGGVVWYMYSTKGDNDTNSNMLKENNISNSINDTKDDKVEGNKIDSTKGIVYSDYEKEYYNHIYKMPIINIDSTDVKKINEEIRNYYEDYINAVNSNDEEAFEFVLMDYDSYVNNDILSLVILWTDPSGGEYYKVYNVNIYTGKLISNAQLLEYKNITTTDFFNKLPDLYGKKFTDKYGTKDSYINNLSNAPAGWTESEIKEQEKFYTEQYNRTISSDNYGIDTPIFLDSNNKINIIAEIYAIAGAEIYNHIINTDI